MKNARRNALRNPRPELCNVEAFAAFVSTFNNATFVRSEKVGHLTFCVIEATRFAAEGIGRESGLIGYATTKGHWSFSF